MIVIEDLQYQTEQSREAAAQIRGGNGPLPGPIGKVKASFEAGYKIGSALDDAFGISDWISGTDDHLIITKDVKNAGNPA